ncbi:MAG: hypothetical protein IJW03_02520, partial [Clostridia bacterium]|nr:hypothetical protein [Clostridia bacterium]
CIIGIVIGALLAVAGIYLLTEGESSYAWFIPAGALLAGLLVLPIVLKLNPAIRAASELLDKHLARANELHAEALAEMAPLNELFDNTETFRLIEKTIPEFSFDNSFTMENYAVLLKKYDFLDMQSAQSSVTDTVSGRFAGNPFLICRSRSHEMGEKTYVGSIVISWQETYRDSNGKLRTRTRTQTLTATVTKPYPTYEDKSYLCYGSQAAPDLSFDRAPKHSERLDEKEIEKKVKRGERKLKKKTERAMRDGKNFQEMANTEFDVLFGADNRDHEVQFRLMYTPLAQKNTVELMTSTTGYGDDFHFNKRHRMNFISSEHSQSRSLNTSGANYVSHDVDEARRRFVGFNADYFKSLFFDFAPLFSIPAYLEEPCASLEPLESYDTNFTTYEHEAMANAVGWRAFAHEASSTEAILKTRLIAKSGDTDRVAVTAYTYVAEPRVDFVPRLGGDGRMHAVPVPWDEYIPLEWTREMLVSPAPVSEREIRRTAESYDGDNAYMHGMWARTI